ncbi:hypothetical protein AQUCO_01100570v1 [Aquilegia coerulea]|uniref:Uncharacterized protein n=1 Tax=Aquilegia coerulea TaxID=218851 RepID=A0A2G5E7N3_AQUCA|nr:hypothetical protein AQUCO_01100570v1 [Aquilegia coerulea]
MDTKRLVNKGTWTAEEDQRLAEYIEIHGAKKWKSVAVKAGLNRCEKSCRLRWLNYLRPNIKRGHFTDQEEDLIIRLHKLLGNRWSLIAGRIPGRTDNDIKNYWNSHLSKKLKQEKLRNSVIQEQSEITTGSVEEPESEITTDHVEVNAERNSKGSDDNINTSFNVDEFFNFSNEGSSNLEWVSKFLEVDDEQREDQNRKDPKWGGYKE